MQSLNEILKTCTVTDVLGHVETIDHEPTFLAKKLILSDGSQIWLDAAYEAVYLREFDPT